MKIEVVSIILSAVVAVSGVAQEYATWGLPEGARMRIGRGAMGELAYSPDGTRLAIASSIGIWLYDTETLKEVDLLTEHTGEVTSVAYSPDGSMLASGSEDKTVRVRDANTGKQKFPPLLHKHAVDSVKFSPDAALLASMSSREVQIWAADTGAKKHTLTGHTDAVTSIAFSPDGNALATGSKDRTMRIWDISDRRAVAHDQYGRSFGQKSSVQSGRRRQLLPAFPAVLAPRCVCGILPQGIFFGRALGILIRRQAWSLRRVASG